MRPSILPFSISLLLIACAEPAERTETVVAVADSTAVAEVEVQTNKPEFAGLFKGTLPCADCPGIETELWIREDGQYLLLETYLNKDPKPFGQMGSWKMTDGQLALLEDSSSIMQFDRNGDDLLLVGHGSKSLSTSSRLSLVSTDGTLADRSMKIMGRYTYEDETHTMQPCGSKVELPLGVQYAGLEMAMWYSEGGHVRTRPLVVEILGHLGRGPAMEGDEMIDYLFVEKVLRKLDSGVCPSRAISLP